MRKLVRGDTCPTCREGKVSRTRRRKWMRHLPASKHLKCSECQSQYLTIYDWAITLPKKGK